MSSAPTTVRDHQLQDLIPPEVGAVANPQIDLPAIARNHRVMSLIEAAARKVPTHHSLWLHDARELDALQPGSVHLVLTSPPYWTLKQYRASAGQMGHISSYETFLDELDRVWAHSYRALVPGGRLICVVGDVCLSRRRNNGRHTVVPLHASIQERCRTLGFDNLAPIIWYKISNAAYEMENGPEGGFLGKPYEPNAVIKNDVEFILMQRKPGGYRSSTVATRILSLISESNHRQWFQQIWRDVPGTSSRNHPAPYHIDLAARLVRMFSFVGDTVLDPFMGTGTTSSAAAQWGRNSIGVEIDPHYFELASDRIRASTANLVSAASISITRPQALHPLPPSQAATASLTS